MYFYLISVKFGHFYRLYLIQTFSFIEFTFLVSFNSNFCSLGWLLPFRNAKHSAFTISSTAFYFYIVWYFLLEANLKRQYSLTRDIIELNLHTSYWRSRFVLFLWSCIYTKAVDHWNQCKLFCFIFVANSGQPGTRQNAG